MINGTETLIFSSDDINFIEYCSSSRQNGVISSAPFLHIEVAGDRILIRGKKNVKKLLSIIVDDYENIPVEVWDFLMSEIDCISDPNAPRFLDELVSFKADSKPCFLSVVVAIGGQSPLHSGVAWGGYSAIYLEASSQDKHTFNINWLTDFIPNLTFVYGSSQWRGTKGQRIIPVAQSKLPSIWPGDLRIYDFGKSFGVSSRFNVGLRAHTMIEVLKGNVNGHTLTQLKKAVVDSVGSHLRADTMIFGTAYNIKQDNTVTQFMSSIEADIIENQRMKEFF